MNLFELFESKASNILDNIDEISYNDPSGWYVSGGCYEFAMALNKVLKGSTIITTDDATGNDMHAFVKYKDKYFDINGMHNSPDAVITDGDYVYTPPLIHNKASFNDLAQYTMQVNMKNVKKLVKELT